MAVSVITDIEYIKLQHFFFFFFFYRLIFFFDLGCQNRAQHAHPRIPRTNAPRSLVLCNPAHYAHICNPAPDCLPRSPCAPGASRPGCWHTHPVTRHLSTAPGITASLRAFGSTQLLRVVFSSTYARSNSAHTHVLTRFPRYCVYSVIVQVLSGRATQAPASPLLPPRPWGRP